MIGRGPVVSLIVVFVACCCPAAGLAKAAQGAPSKTTATAAFIPNKLGAHSTLELGFHVYRPGGALPPPLVGIEFLLAAGVSLSTSTLGLDSCDQAVVVNGGAQGCLSDAVMGYGSALLVAPTAVEGILEPAAVTVLMAPAEDRHTTLLFDVDGTTPVIAQVVFSGQMLDASDPFGGNLSTTLPITPGLPGEQAVSVVSLRAGIGSKGVTYYKTAHGVRAPYRPQGMVEPAHCPAGGFPFKVKVRFADGSNESASTTAPCPAAGRRAHRGRHK